MCGLVVGIIDATSRIGNGRWGGRTGIERAFGTGIVSIDFACHVDCKSVSKTSALGVKVKHMMDSNDFEKDAVKDMASQLSASHEACQGKLC